MRHHLSRPLSTATLAILLVVLVGAILFLRPYLAISQSSAAPLTGYAWSDNIGWISLSGASYGLAISPDGTISGDAWSDNIGWISANSYDLTGCPTAPCTARYANGVFSGWLRALSTNGGWDGFISLSGSGYGVTASNGALSGDAWGSDVVGWIDFAYASAPIASCSLPWGSTLASGASVNAYQASTTPYGSACTMETRTCTNGTLSGSYQYGSCTVQPPADCTLDGVTVTNGSSHTFYMQRTTTAGQLCSSYAQSRTCTNGVLSGSDTYQYASCSCAAAYFCSGSTIQYADTSCNVSTVTSCASPGRCQVGSNSCVYDAVSASFYADPQIVSKNSTSWLYWNATNAQSCTVTGGGQSWTQTSSMPGGVQTIPITSRTTYTLNCIAYPGQSNFSATTDVLLQPQYQEK